MTAANEARNKRDPMDHLHVTCQLRDQYGEGEGETWWSCLDEVEAGMVEHVSQGRNLAEAFKICAGITMRQ